MSTPRTGFDNDLTTFDFVTGILFLLLIPVLIFSAGVALGWWLWA